MDEVNCVKRRPYLFFEASSIRLFPVCGNKAAIDDIERLSTNPRPLTACHTVNLSLNRASRFRHVGGPHACRSNRRAVETTSQLSGGSAVG